MKPIKAWMIVGSVGPVTIDERLPVYWLRRPAKDELAEWSPKYCRLVRVEIREVKRKASQKGTHDFDAEKQEVA
jgi:hypothetical protein